jgi:hypothetical protein
MDSSKLSSFGFSSWYPFSKENLRKAPEEIGVYVFRKAKAEMFGRLNGKSDILYIGSSKKGLRSRLQNYMHPGPTQWTNQRIHEYTVKNSVEVSWLTFQGPKNLEHDLLKQYFSDHWELPPLNFAAIRTLFKPLKDKIHLTENVRIIKK